MKKDSLTISYNELMKELDKFRPTHGCRIRLTPEQENFIKKARLHKNPITLREMCRLWEKVGWGKIAQNTLRSRCLQVLGVDKLNDDRT